MCACVLLIDIIVIVNIILRFLRELGFIFAHVMICRTYEYICTASTVQEINNKVTWLRK